MKIYTKTGDRGETGLLSGQRVPKDDLRVKAYGAVDEANAALGLARALSKHASVREIVYELQKKLLIVGALLAFEGGRPSRPDIAVTAADVEHLERLIDELDASLSPLKNFIIPGDTAGGAALDMARTIVRRAERHAVSLSRERDVDSTLLVYLNRLSDLLFILSRYENEIRPLGK